MLNKQASITARNPAKPVAGRSLRQTGDWLADPLDEIFPSAEEHFALSPQQVQWVRRTAASLKLEQKIAQLTNKIVIFWDDSKDPRKLAEDALENEAGGAFLFGRTSAYMYEISQILRQETHIPIITCADFELGPMGITDGTRFGDNMNLGAVGDRELARELAYTCGKTAALEGRVAGVDWAFGPVVDIPFNPDSSITNVRCYSRDPVRIGELAAAYVKGLQEHGMAATLKHFPGDGTDSRDQHLTTSLNRFDLSRWRQTYGHTFGAGIAAGAYSVMMGHIAMPACGQRDPISGLPLPATLDPVLHNALLRGELGFGGVIVSDALGMLGIMGHCRNKAEAFARNIAAGSDMGLFVEDIPAAVEAVLRLLDRGEISLARIESALHRVLCLKAKLGLPERTADRYRPVLNREEAAACARRLARESLTLVCNRDEAYPLRVQKGDKVVVCNLPEEARSAAALPPPGECLPPDKELRLCAALRERGLRSVCVQEIEGVRRECADAAALVYVFNARPGGSMGSIRLSKAALCAIDWEIVRSEMPVLFFAPGNPFVAWEQWTLPNLVCGYSPTVNVQEAFCEALLGDIPFAGTLPVELPE